MPFVRNVAHDDAAFHAWMFVKKGTHEGVNISHARTACVSCARTFAKKTNTGEKGNGTAYSTRGVQQ